MSTEDEIRQQRRKEAEDKKIYTKAVEIAKRLGEVSSKKHGANHIYVSEDGMLHLNWDDFGPNLTIIWGPIPQRYVYYNQLGTLRLYRPDIEGWEKKIEDLYRSLTPVLQREIDASKDKEKEEFFTSWGLRPTG